MNVGEDRDVVAAQRAAEGERLGAHAGARPLRRHCGPNEDLEPHEIANKLFLKKVARFQQRFAAQEDMFEEMHASLTRWIGFHIHMMNRQ